MAGERGGGMFIGGRNIGSSAFEMRSISKSSGVEILVGSSDAIGVSEQ